MCYVILNIITCHLESDTLYIYIGGARGDNRDQTHKRVFIEKKNN